MLRLRRSAAPQHQQNLLPAEVPDGVRDGVAIWNEFFTPLLYLGGTPNVTVPVQIYGFVGEYSSD
jgi:raffinose/stachyose/melibiose transport system permease protein